MTATVRIPGRLEAAFGADLTASQATWTWTDLSDRLMRSGASIKAGRQDETGHCQPATLGVTLKNKDGGLTPRNPLSRWYPNVRRNVPLRYSVRAGPPHLTTTGAAGSRASTPDNAALDITGDWFVAAEVEPPILVPPAGINYDVVGKAVSGTSNISLEMNITPGNLLWVRWSPDGTVANQKDAFSSIQLPRTLWSTMAFGIWLDVNNGSGGWNVHFYFARTLADILADPLGAEFSIANGAGVTSVFNSTAPLEIGDVVGTGWSGYPGKFRKVQVRSGDSTGTIVANPDFTTQPVGVTAFTDSAGRPWTVNAPATIEDWQIRFVGQVDSWQPAWPDGIAPGTARVNVSASGILRRLTQGTKPLASTIYRSVTAPINKSAVKAYWPMEDGSNATRAGSPIPGVLPMTVVGVEFAKDDTYIASAPLAQISGGAGFSWSGIVPTYSGSHSHVDMYLNIPTAPASNTALLFVQAANGRVAQWVVTISTTTVGIVGTDGDGVGVVLDSFPTVPSMFGQWMLLTLDLTQSGGNTNWQVGLTPIPQGIFFFTSGSYAGLPGRVSKLLNFATAPPDGMSVGHMIVTVNKDIGWLAGADTAYDSETAGARVTRLCSEEGISLIFQGDADDTMPMGPQGQATLMDLLEEAADAGFGMLCEQRHAMGLTYRTRDSIYNQTPHLVIDELSGALVNPFEPVLDDQRIRNDITVKQPNGSLSRQVDDASAAAEDRYTDDVTVNVHSDTQLNDQAGWRLHQGTWPEMRYPALNIKVGNSTLADAWLHAGPGDLIRVRDLPAEHPTGSVDLLMEGYSEQPGSFRWDAGLACSPGGIWTVGVIEDPVLGHLDTTSSQLATSETALAVGSTDTWSVATITGPVWIDSATYPTEFPFDVQCDGEAVTVTAITGTTSPQSFTVTRGINGFTKAHSSGAAISLANPLVVAL